MVADKDVKNTILTIVEKIKKEYQPEKIILFGSYAWGNSSKDSDIDLFIIKKTNERHIDRWLKVRKIVYQENLRIPFEPLVYTPEEVQIRLQIGDSFIKQILNKGEVLYG
ncbi:MAG: nucleotidyltransferase domain-containing protein [Candidatus Omnitrophota bacterium]|nr:nucleotidyltransferase domain-containing protein [Candidatus Omnitrophota bacterium]